MQSNHGRAAPAPWSVVTLSAPWSVVTLSLATIGLVACGSETPPPRAPPGAAMLAVDGLSGADLTVDGVYVGTLPLAEPVTADPGAHDVRLTMNGHLPEARVVTLRRGETTALALDLDETAQRTGAWISIAAGGAWVAVGVVFGVLALVEDRNARDLVQRLDQGVSASEKGDYDAAIATRDRYRIASGMAAGSGLGLFVIGAFMFALDDRGTPPVRAPDVAQRPRFSLTPSVGPGVVGLTSELRY